MYERLPNFCYLCGKLGHLNRDCDIQVSADSHPSYGNWLRAISGTWDRKGLISSYNRPISSGLSSVSIIASVARDLNTNTIQGQSITPMGVTKVMEGGMKDDLVVGELQNYGFRGYRCGSGSFRQRKRSFGAEVYIY